MKAVFVELPAFERHRRDYLADGVYLQLQRELMANPHVGDVIKGTGGLRKMRFQDDSRGKGKRGGLRVIYYWWTSGAQFWLFTVYGKDEMADLTEAERKLLSGYLKSELNARAKS